MTEATDLEGLTLLGQKSAPSKRLETFPNRHPARRYVVRLRSDEFTCMCPATGQPDFARISVEYIPDRKILESKSFKLYLWSYRNEGVFHEHVTNTILDDLVAALEPHWCRIEGAFNVRGGIGITVVAEHGQRDESLGAAARGDPSSDQASGDKPPSSSTQDARDEPDVTDRQDVTD